MKTDPPLLSILGSLLRKRKRLQLVNWLQDLYPEIANHLGVPFIRGPVLQCIITARNWSLRHADSNVVVGTKMAERVREAGADPKRVHIIPNWTNDELVKPIEHAENPLIEQWGLKHKFIIGYSGNLGRAHEFDTVLGAAAQLSDNPSVVFLFIGGGKLTEELRFRVEQRGLSKLFQFRAYQPAHLLMYSLSAPHVHWLSLRPELEGLIVPSKFYGIAAAGRPILAVMAPDGELGSIVRKFRSGLVVQPGDAEALAEAIQALSADRAACVEMGRRAREMLEQHFGRKEAIASWSSLLNRLSHRVRDNNLSLKTAAVQAP
jgi:colanic acid biosynthesis glycosyl transferase WcaI